MLPVAGRVNSTGSWGLLFSLTEALAALGERELPARWYELVVEACEVNHVVIGHFAPGHLARSHRRHRCLRRGCVRPG